MYKFLALIKLIIKISVFHKKSILIAYHQLTVLSVVHPILKGGTITNFT